MMSTRSLTGTGLQFAVGTALLAAGCALGPEPQRPETAADGTVAYLHSADADSGEVSLQETSGSWWQRIGDPEIVDLVEQALENNTDLMAAAARVLEAEAQLERAGGSRWPQVSASVGASRVKNSFVLPNIGRTEIYSTNYSDDLTVSYVVDLLGKLKRTRQSAWASLLATEASRQALEHAIVAGIVKSRVAVANLEQSVTISEQIRESWAQTLETVERRYRGGLVAAVDLYLARENLSATQAAEVQLRGRLAQARHALDVLVGRRPGTGPLAAATLPELPDPEPLPVGLPADLLEQRPDVRQAEMQVAAATYGVGVALADLFPSLTLSASAGMVGDSLSDLTSSDGLVYSAVANLLAPIFNGGQRRADVDAARARVEQASAHYAGSVLTALREVEDALVAESSAWQRLEFTQRRLGEARAADRVARERYQRGVESLLKVLETERRLRSAEEALITTRGDLWNARVDLHLALGGDWTLRDKGEADHLAMSNEVEEGPDQKNELGYASSEVLR
jgi:multidrug efflux system outer membrane protein